MEEVSYSIEDEYRDESNKIYIDFPGGVLPPHMGRGVPPILSNPDPIYDKRMGISTPCL